MHLLDCLLWHSLHSRTVLQEVLSRQDELVQAGNGLIVAVVTAVVSHVAMRLAADACLPVMTTSL